MQINKWTVSGTSPQVRSLRKVNNNDQVAIAIDADADNGSQIADEDDDKGITIISFVLKFFVTIL